MEMVSEMYFIAIEDEYGNWDYTETNEWHERSFYGSEMSEAERNERADLVVPVALGLEMLIAQKHLRELKAQFEAIHQPE